MKICIIGESGHYSYILDGIRGNSDARIVGVAPGSEGETVEKLQHAVESRLGYAPRRFDDYRTMLDTLEPDVVGINCYFRDHARVGVEVLSRAMHTFIEKPVATTFEDLETLRDAYTRSGVHLAAMFGIRYSPHFLTGWKAVRDGAVGEVRLMNAQKSYKLGSRGINYRNREIYGGTIPWVGSHAIDWLHWFCGKRFQSVFASHSTTGNRGHGDLEATALCHFTFSNDVYGSASIDYLRPATALTHDDDRIRVVGTEGVLEVRGSKVYLINDESNGDEELPLQGGPGIFEDFLAQVRGESTCMVSAEDSFYVTEACLRARLSADERRIVDFPA